MAEEYMEQLNIPANKRKALHEIVKVMIKDNYGYNEDTIKEIIRNNYNLM